MGDRLGTAGVVGFFFFSSTWSQFDFLLSTSDIFTLYASSYRVFTHILHTKAHCGKAATAYDHTTLSTPLLIWSLKLSSVGPAQYLDGWPPGNSRCCRLLFFPSTWSQFDFLLSTCDIFSLLCVQTHTECPHIFYTQKLTVVRQLLPMTMPHWVHQFSSDHWS